MNSMQVIKIECSDDEMDIADIIVIDDDSIATQQQRAGPSQQQTATTTTAAETRVLLKTPFFILDGNFDAIGENVALSARCANCGIIIWGRKNNTLNFLRHLRRKHLEVYRTFESMKQMNFHTFGASRGGGDDGTQASTANSQPIVVKSQNDTESDVRSVLTDCTQATGDTAFENLLADIEDLKNEVRRLRVARQRMQMELSALDRTVRRHKLIFYNVKIELNEQPIEVILDILKDRLQLYNVSIRNINVLNRQSTLNKYRVLVEFAHEDDVDLIMRNVRKLRSTGIFVEQEPSKFAQKRKMKLMALRRELMRRNNSLKVFVRNCELITGGQQFYWDDVEGLSCLQDTNSTFTAETAVERLHQVTNEDLTQFLTNLHN